MRYGALEAGGTKMVMGILNERMEIIRSTACATRAPEETMKDILSFFEGEQLDAMGIATFGPVNLDKNSEDYGSITSTPKLAWRNYPLYKTIKDALNVPTLVDTDVNAAALAEATMGAAKGLENILYVTVGTGIGGGLLVGVAGSCTACCTLNGGIYRFPAPRTIRCKGAYALTMRCALKGWLQGRPYKRAGECPQRIYLKTIWLGTWRAIIWRSFA